MSPQGKRLTMICASLVLLQIMFAVHRFAQGATAPAALRVADCRSAAMLIKSALRDLLFCVIWHDKHSGHWLAALVTKGGHIFPRAKPGLHVFPRSKARLLGFTIRGRLL